MAFLENVLFLVNDVIRGGGESTKREVDDAEILDSRDEVKMWEKW